MYHLKVIFIISVHVFSLLLYMHVDINNTNIVLQTKNLYKCYRNLLQAALLKKYIHIDKCSAFSFIISAI